MANNFLFAQLQPYSLSGSGAVIGDTTLVLKSMLDINGAALTMAGTFGTIGYGTLEPGNGTLEEQISFTGLTNNANGTVTLTGVKTVLFVSPYTETSGLGKTHAGSTTFIISNTAGFYNKFVTKDNDGTVTQTLLVPTPTVPTQVVNKAYADALAIAGAPNASPTVQGLVQIASRAQFDAGTVVGSTSAYLVPPMNVFKSYLVDTGSPNVIILAASPAIASYVTGQQFSTKVLFANTSPTVTINVNGLGAKNLVKFDGSSSPSAGDITAGQMIIVEYDGTNFQMQTPPVNLFPSGAMTMYGGSSAPSGWLLCNGSPVSRTTYAALFSVIASTYGNGDASTTFNVPDMRGRVPVGAGTGSGGGAAGSGLPSGGTALTAIAAGGWKGEETHQLITAELASHTHTVPVNTTGSGSGSSITTSTTGFTVNTSVTTSSTGSDTAHNNIQPQMGVNYIIKT